MISQFPKFTALIIMGLVLATALFGIAKSDPNTSLVKYICNGNGYASGDPFENSVAYVLMDLMNVTPSQQSYDYRTVSPYPTAVAYGHATCSQALNNNDCANCLVSAKATVSGTCAGRIGGQVQLGDCTMRFENYPF